MNGILRFEVRGANVEELRAQASRIIRGFYGETAIGDGEHWPCRMDVHTREIIETDQAGNEHVVFVSFVADVEHVIDVR